MHNILTIDVEEYFHPTEVQASGRRYGWSSLPSRVESQTQVVLDLLDRHKATATFFILGWVAERHPRMVRDILASGHEIGCHSYAHRLVYDLSPNEFEADTKRAMAAIEDAGGVRPRAYRAPSYSITSKSVWAFEILVQCGFLQDSSIYPIFHDRYGIPGFSRHPTILRTRSGPIQEFPVATAELAGGRVAPVGGGAYLRLLPYSYTAAGIHRINQVDKQPACIYFHPWELDPLQPRLAKGLVSHLRTYGGLRTMKSKVERLLSDFEFSSIATTPKCQFEAEWQQNHQGQFVSVAAD